MSDIIMLPAVSANASVLPLVACPTEDSTNCYWDATQHGNGYGQSFIDIDGTTYPLDQPDNSYILTAVVNPLSPTGYGVAYQMVDPSPAYDLTFPIVVVASALIVAAVTFVVGFLRRDKVS